MPKQILIVDDDPHILDVVVFALEKAGMITLSATNGAEAISVFQKSGADIIVLDISMPEMDGLDVCREIRKTSEVPILFLSSRDEEIDRILGLEMGADDYLTKPFSPRELVARVKAILKRATHYNSAKSVSNNKSYVYGSLLLECDQHRVLWKDKPLDLTATEFALLKVMMKTPEHVFDRDRLMDHAYDLNINVNDRTIDSHIRNIRQKAANVGCEEIIKTVRGVGYKLA